MARRATKIQQTRATDKNVLLLDAGNSLYADQGPNLAAQGKYTVDGMNRLGYDAMTLGNLDFIWPVDVLQQRIAEAKFAVLSCNVYVGGSQTLLAKPYVIKEIGGRRIAIIGVTSQTLSATAPAAGSQPVLVSNPTEAVKKVMADLQGKADVFVVLSNLGFAEDNQLAADVPGIAVIIGGRSSTILAEPFRDSATKTLVTQAGFQGEWIGALKVNFDTQGKSTTYKGSAVVLSADFPDDPAIRAWLDTIPK